MAKLCRGSIFRVGLNVMPSEVNRDGSRAMISVDGAMSVTVEIVSALVAGGVLVGGIWKTFAWLNKKRYKEIIYSLLSGIKYLTQNALMHYLNSDILCHQNHIYAFILGIIKGMI